MPAYFSLYTVFKREDIYPEFMNDFYNHLFECGLKFKSGCWDEKNLPLHEIVLWNQQKLANNFHLGMSEHCRNDYKQIFFDFCNFAEVRGYWLNNYPVDDEFTFSIIVPESDLIEDYSTNPLTFNAEIEKLKSLAEYIWSFKLIQSIQTSPELADDNPVPLDRIKKGEAPLADPFAIIPKEYISKLQVDIFTQNEISKNGILLRQTSGSYQKQESLSMFGHIAKFFKHLF